MTVQSSASLRNAWLDQITTTLGAGWKLKIRTGTQPANVATASSGTVLVTFTPTAASASGGAKTMVTSTPLAGTAAASGTAGHYELTTSGDTVHQRGSVTATGDGGDLTIDNLGIASSQAVNITGFTITAPGA